MLKGGYNLFYLYLLAARRGEITQTQLKPKLLKTMFRRAEREPAAVQQQTLCSKVL